MTDAKMYRNARLERATPIVLHVSARFAWHLFYGVARINRFHAGKVIANLPHDARMAHWYALSCTDAVDWLAIRADLSTSFPASPASVFRNTHGY